jgi:hypothetical protein
VESDESLKVHGRAEGVHFEAGMSRIFAAKRGSARRHTSTGRKRYDGLLPDKMRRLKQLEDKNNKLKKVVVDLSLERRCCRMPCAENFEACPEAQAG